MKQTKRPHQDPLKNSVQVSLPRKKCSPFMLKRVVKINLFPSSIPRNPIKFKNYCLSTSNLPIALKNVQHVNKDKRS